MDWWVELLIAFGSSFAGVFLGIWAQGLNERKQRHVDRLRDTIVAPVEERLRLEYERLVPSSPAITIRGHDRETPPQGVRGPFRPHQVRQWMNHSWLQDEAWRACVAHWPELGVVGRYLEVRHNLSVQVNQCFESLRRAYEVANRDATTITDATFGGFHTNLALRDSTVVANWLLDMMFDHDYTSGGSFKRMFHVKQAEGIWFAQPAYPHDAIFGTRSGSVEVTKRLRVLVRHVDQPEVRNGASEAVRLAQELDTELDQAHSALRGVLHQVGGAGTCTACKVWPPWAVRRRSVDAKRRVTAAST